MMTKKILMSISEERSQTEMERPLKGDNGVIMFNEVESQTEREKLKFEDRPRAEIERFVSNKNTDTIQEERRGDHVTKQLDSPQKLVSDVVNVHPYHKAISPQAVTVHQDWILPEVVILHQTPILPEVVISQQKPLQPGVVTVHQDPILPEVVTLHQKPVSQEVVTVHQRSITSGVVTLQEDHVIPEVATVHQKHILPEDVTVHQEALFGCDTHKSDVVNAQQLSLTSLNSIESGDAHKIKERKKVQWSDDRGKELVHVIEFKTSDEDSEEEEDNDDTDSHSCTCCIQ